MQPYLQLPATFTQSLTGTEDFVTDGDWLIEFCQLAWKTPENPAGLTLDPWQKWLIRHALERYPVDYPDARKAGRLRYRQIVVSVARQSGKSLLAAIFGLWGLLMQMPLGGAQVLGLASSADQARIVYTRVLFVINGNPHLKKRFRKATDTRGIMTADGSSRYDIKAASERALQGIPISLCLADELHLFKKGMWSAAVKGTSTFKDGLVLGITTAGDETSSTLIDLYTEGRKAANGDKTLERFGFFLWTAPDNAPVDDVNAILAANPAAAAGRIEVERILEDMRTMPEHEIRRYTLNQFITGTVASWLPGDLFKKAAGQGITNTTGLVFAVDRTQNWTHATIAAANNNGDIVETELVASFVAPNENQIYDELVSLYKKHKPRAIALDDRQMPNLGKRLKTAGIPVWQLWTKEVSAACSTVFALYSTNQIRHNNDPLLIAQMPNGVSKYTGETWLISRKDSVGDIDAVMSTLFAIYVAHVSKRAGLQVF
jgi:phage terminase large subunit-like protein